MGTEESQLPSPTALLSEDDPVMLRRNMEICVWCGNRIREVCVPCQQEGGYRHLEPAPLDSWEQPPELPAMRELVDLPVQERLALIWLSVRYSQTRGPPGDI